MNQKELRDHFALHAPDVPKDFARIGRQVEKEIVKPRGGTKTASVQEWETSAQYRARWAYAYADAMLAARVEQ